MLFSHEEYVGDIHFYRNNNDSTVNSMSTNCQSQSIIHQKDIGVVSYEKITNIIYISHFNHTYVFYSN